MKTQYFGIKYMVVKAVYNWVILQCIRLISVATLGYFSRKCGIFQITGKSAAEVAKFCQNVTGISDGKDRRHSKPNLRTPKISSHC